MHHVTKVALHKSSSFIGGSSHIKCWMQFPDSQYVPFPAQGEHGQLIDDLGLLYKNAKHAEGMDMKYTLCTTETQTIAKATLALQGQRGGE